MIILDTDHLSILQHFDSPHAIELRQRILAVEEQRIVTTIVTYEEQVRSWLSQIGRRSDVIEQVPFTTTSSNLPRSLPNGSYYLLMKTLQRFLINCANNEFESAAQT